VRAGRQRAGILRDGVRGLLFIGVAMTINHAVKQTTFGKQLELTSYNLLQLQLSSEDPPVTVVDISDLEQQDFNLDGRTVRATPRDSLRKMLEAIAEQHPKAIGVDIDFSPDSNGLLPSDPAFFEFCKNIKKVTGVPVFLGIKRTLHGPPAQWLGSERYETLAVNILIPNDSRRMVNLITVSGDSSRPMSVALADSYGREASNVPGWLQRIHAFTISRLTRWHLVDSVTETRFGSRLAVEDFLVDFSALESMEERKLRTISPLVLRDPSQRKWFEGKVVLLGDATLGKATDPFLVPGRQQPYPGVFLHASAAYTLIKAPLFEVTHGGRLAIDALFSLAILVAVLSIRLYYSRTRERVATHRLQGVFTLLVVGVAIVGGVWFVRFTRVMWDDFMLALAFLIFHPSIERLLEASGAQIRISAPWVWRRLALEDHEEKPK
jgi:CHASE2 domain-containing sensor protein